jgi:hypothetical protein
MTVIGAARQRLQKMLCGAFVISDRADGYSKKERGSHASKPKKSLAEAGPIVVLCPVELSSAKPGRHSGHASN